MVNFKRLGLLVMLGFSISANAQEVRHELSAPQHDSSEVAAKHIESDNILEHVARPFIRAYKAVEYGVVEGYKVVEETFVEGYKSIERGIVNRVNDNTGSSINFKRGYRANIGLAASIPDMWEITTSHGFSFGNGLYLGGGVGFAAEFTPTYKSAPIYLTPLFVDFKYSFDNRQTSPFINLSTGAYADITNIGIRYFLNPSLGVDIGRFSINVGYEYQLGVWNYNCGVSKHNAKLGVSYTF